MGTPIKYATKEEYLKIHRQRALEYYYEHRNENLESKREYAKQHYQKNRKKILTERKRTYQESKKAAEEPKIIVTPNFILEIIG